MQEVSVKYHNCNTELLTYRLTSVYDADPFLGPYRNPNFGVSQNTLKYVNIEVTHRC